MTKENTNVIAVNLNGKIVEVQLILQASIIGSVDLLEDQKAEYLAHAMTVSVNGTDQTSNLRLSQSGGLVASFMVKDAGRIAPRKVVAEKGAGKGAMKARATASLKAAFEQPEEAAI